MLEPTRAGHAEFEGTPRFEVVACVGQGGTGVVYEVHDRERDEPVALKTLRAPSAETILLLKKEFRSVQDLRHPNLVQLHELFEEQGQWFFTMEFVRGSDFLGYVRGAPSLGPPRGLGPGEKVGSVAVPRLRKALGQLALGLCALHGAHKVHRDIKPSNVMVTRQGRVVILDFGIVSDLDRTTGREEGPAGTVHYMAPEQVLGEAVGPAADWYAFGAMLYQALTGRVPFMGLSGDVIERKVTMLPQAPRELEPDVPADLDALCMALLSIDPTERPSGAEVLERLAYEPEPESAAQITQTSVFVGRRGELRTLEQAYAEVCRGQGVTVLVHGESGVGKSFLVRQFTDRVGRVGSVKIHRGRCYESEFVPYKAFDGIVDEICLFLTDLAEEAVTALLPPNAGLLCRVFPVLEQVPAIARARSTAEDISNPKELRQRVFTALRGLLANLARSWPMVLIIDDLQWADADSLALLVELTRPPAPPPFLLVATQRVATETRRRMRAGEIEASRLEGDVRHVYLDPLPEDDARMLVAQLMGGGQSDADVKAIAAEAKGHPLFIDELIRRRGTLPHDGAPLRLDEAVWQRVGLLEPAARKLLELVATAGKPLRQAVTADVVATDFGHLMSLVSQLRAANFVRTTGVHREDTIEPYHDRVRESVLAHLTHDARAAWHGRLAHALERAGDADPETLATHWLEAGDRERAATHALKGADKAAAALAFDNAVRLYRLALELQPTTSEQARPIRIKTAEALVNCGRAWEAAQVYREVAGAVVSKETLELHRRAAEEYLCSGHFEEGEGVLRDVLAALGESYPDTQASALASLVWSRILLRFRGLDFKRRDPSSVEPEALQRIDALCSAGSGFAMMEPVRGSSFHGRQLRASLRVGEPYRVARALCMYAISTASGGGPTRIQTAKELATIRAIMATIDPDPFLEGYARSVRAFAHYFIGEWDRAAEALLEAEKAFRDDCVGVAYELNAVRLLLCRTQVIRGDLRDLAARAPAYLREADQRGDLHASVAMRGNAAYLLALARGDLEDTERVLETAEKQLPATGFQYQHYYCIAGRVQLDLYRGDGSAAYQRWIETWPKAKRGLLFAVQATLIGALDQRARSMLTLAAASATPDTSLLRKAEADIRAIEKNRMAWGMAVATLLRGSLLSIRGDKASALEAMTSAATALEGLGMHLHAAVARRRQGELLGGDEGRELVAQATAWMQGQGVRDPERISAVYAPRVAP